MFDLTIDLNDLKKYMHITYDRTTYEFFAIPKSDIILWIKEEKLHLDFEYFFKDMKTSIIDKAKIEFKDFIFYIETELEFISGTLTFDTIESRNLFKLTWS